MLLLRKQLKIGTRGSKLALWQAEFAKKRLEDKGFECEIVPIKTSGDKTDKPLYQLGGKGLFIKEIEKALLDKTIDIAVHSLKDMSVFEDERFDFIVFERDYWEDIFVSFEGNFLEIKKNARVGTSSLRRRAELLQYRDDFEFVDLRGNLDTRLKKLRDGEVDAIVVSKSGLKRLGLYDEAYMYDLRFATPAAGQGVIAVEFLSDFEFRDELKQLEDEKTRICIDSERAFVRQFNASCNYPIGALARFEQDEFFMQITYGFVDNLRRVIKYSRRDISPLFVFSDVVEYVKKKVKDYENRG
ncbi:hydroxymethylbilane synthase [Hippea maritima]|uniref:Hydroxymethylbilane synthase n=1 Tax=Hippea maritima (strain ATCC 700847 / DSM 10411 / MH2) TaxID=760142 RepID=F2LWE6_HIPMA|nr:hydroxymethylbilane synthase [Hippea maritima]AEA32992.1 porphobilinogen deaminase [Hippea maritima DSM 10411]